MLINDPLTAPSKWSIIKELRGKKQRMTRTVTVKPKSSKAKNRLANMMDNNPVCVVEQETSNHMLFLASENKKYFFWVSTKTTDADWEVL